MILFKFIDSVKLQNNITKIVKTIKYTYLFEVTQFSTYTFYLLFSADLIALSYFGMFYIVYKALKSCNLRIT